MHAGSKYPLTELYSNMKCNYDIWFGNSMFY